MFRFYHENSDKQYEISCPSTVPSLPETILPYGDFAKLVLAALGAADVPYMVGGSVAAWGEPRATREEEWNGQQIHLFFLVLKV
ncbi:MAG: hypothetical protein AB1649_24685 [Chloroflexota bacterium]